MRIPAVRHIEPTPTLAREHLLLEVERVRLCVIGALQPTTDVSGPLAVIDAGRALPGGGRVNQLRARLGIAHDDVALLWFAVAWAHDPLLAAHTGTLATDPQRGATLAAFVRVSGWNHTRSRDLAQRILRPTHPLFAAGMLETSDPANLGPMTPLRVPRRVVDHLAGVDDVDAVVQAVGGLLRPPEQPVLDDRAQAIVRRLVQLLCAPAPAVAILEGPAGVGRRTLAAVAAQGRRMIHVDLARLPRGVSADPTIAALLREHLLSNAIPMVAGLETTRGDDAEAAGRRAAVSRLLATATGTVVLVTADPSIELETRRAVVRLGVPPPEAASRRALWVSALSGASHDAAAATTVALRFKLPPAAIERAAAAARLLAHQRGAESIDESDLTEGVRVSVHERLGGIAQRLAPRHDWNDLVVPGETMDEILQLVARARFAFRVLHEWGFDRHVSGTGIAALFSGPPGTGKTMVAGLIARELGLDLYRVDLSQVVSKWIGETEKQLGRLFDAAETGHALLLFDEADSLFAKRTEVKGANDRYANLEVNYLLQRIEVFGGVALLTTNLDSSIDDAFRRRLAAHIVFPAPNEDERALLWRRLLPEQAPTAPDLDLAALADRYADFTGGHIRNATLTAAYLAASEDAPISQRHLQHAAIEQARAMGRMFYTGRAKS